jgi:hypothetical protein
LSHYLLSPGSQDHASCWVLVAACSRTGMTAVPA